MSLQMELLQMDLAATLCFAYIGAVIAFRNKVSCLGVILSAMLTAMGGGTVRSVLLQNEQIFWMENNQYLLAIAAAVPLACITKNKVNLQSKILFVADSVSTAIFIMLGIVAARNTGCGAVATAIMGILTGIGGTVLREAIVENKSVLLSDQANTLSVAMTAIVGVLLANSPMAHNQLTKIESNVVTSAVILGSFLIICRILLPTVFQTINSLKLKWADYPTFVLHSRFDTKPIQTNNLATKCRTAKKSRFNKPVQAIN